MRLLLSSFLILVSSFPLAGHAQTSTVLKDKNNRLIESLKVPTGKTLTIESGATINATGATITGFTASAAWADITGKPSTFPPEYHTQAISTITGLQTALDAKASTASLADYLTSATAASTYQPIIADGSLALSKLATTGDLTVTSLYTENSVHPTRVTQLTASGLSWYDVNGSGFGFTLRPAIGVSITDNRIVSFNPNGNLVSTADTGTVTGTMVADATISGAKLATSYLPLTGGTLTGALVITQGTANTGLLSSNGYSLTGSNATPAIDIAGTLNTSGNPAVMQVAMTTTAAGSTTALARFLGTTSGTANVFAVLAPVANAQASAAIQIGAGLFCGEYAASSEWWFGFTNNKFAGKFAIDTIGTKVANNGYYAFGGDTFANSSADLLLRRDAAARLQLGTDSATPISQQIKTADGVGTNIAASNLTLGGSTSTGTGAGGDVLEVTSMSGSSGSSANATQTRRQTIGRFVNLTEGTATAVASIALASGKVVGGTATITVWASDGTDHQVITRDVTFNAANKAGTISSTAASGLSAASAGAGSLSFTFDTAASGNNLLLRANATSDLTQTILRCRLVITALNGDDVQTVTPQ